MKLKRINDVMILKTPTSTAKYRFFYEDFDLFSYQAFKKLDSDRDGQISEMEFIEGVGGKLEVSIPITVAKAVFRRLDSSGSGSIKYHDFIDRFQMLFESSDFDAAEISDENLLEILSLKHKNIYMALDRLGFDKNLSFSSTEASIASTLPCQVYV